MTNHNCPGCGEEAFGPTVLHIEIREVYDGISFWKHSCGTVWSRWTGEIVPNWDELTREQRVALAREHKRSYDTEEAITDMLRSGSRERRKESVR